MTETTLFLIETGLHLDIPTLDSLPASTLPIWGDYFFLDFFLSNFSSPHLPRRILILEGEHRKAQSFINAAWKRKQVEVLPLAKGMREFINVLKEETSERVILSATSYVGVFKWNEVEKLVASPSEDHIKVSVDGIPSDLYILKRMHLIDLLIEHENRFHKSKNFPDLLFNEILLSSFDTLENIPGHMIFKNNLMQLYRENILLLERQKLPDFQAILRNLSQSTLERSQSYVGEKAYIRRSFIASDVEIQGFVENSILFPGVVVGRKTKIINSVIMNNNQVGRGAVIQNALIFPYQKEVKKGAFNIGNDAIIGGPASTAKNNDYPNQINGGITVIGCSAEVPRGVSIEPGCYLDGGANRNQLRNLKKLKRGRSLFSDESTISEQAKESQDAL